MFTTLFTHRRHRLPAHQQVTRICGIIAAVATMLETVKHVVLHRSPSHAWCCGGVEQIIDTAIGIHSRVALRLAVGTNAIGVVHEYHDVNEDPQQRRGNDYLASMQTELAAKHDGGTSWGREKESNNFPGLPAHEQHYHNSSRSSWPVSGGDG